MKMNEVYALEFARGLRSVQGYVDSLCGTCHGSCGEHPDDQCLISAWAAYIRAAEEDGHQPFEAGQRCGLAKAKEASLLHKPSGGSDLPELPCH